MAISNGIHFLSNGLPFVIRGHDVITVAETAEFIKKAKKLLAEDERQELVSFLADHPASGIVMEGTGGIRKLRWARQGMGKAVASG